MHPTQFKRASPGEVLITWSDGRVSQVSLRTLRDGCPCAGCRGETVLLRSYAPEPADPSTPGRYELTGAEAIGNYAIRLSWADGHDHGIYTWEQLRDLCGCDERSTR